MTVGSTSVKVKLKDEEEEKTTIVPNTQAFIELVQDKIAEGNLIWYNLLNRFYNEFEPDVYVRTYQLLRSLVKTDVKSTINGWVAEVYFDINALDYSTRIVPQGQPWSEWASPNTTLHRQSWTDANTEWVLKTAMTGGNTGKPHGGYASGTAIWNESMRVLSKEGIEILKQELIKAGISVR